MWQKSASVNEQMADHTRPANHDAFVFWAAGSEVTEMDATQIFLIVVVGLAGLGAAAALFGADSRRKNDRRSI